MHWVKLILFEVVEKVEKAWAQILEKETYRDEKK
jgi:hypothetical protein